MAVTRSRPEQRARAAALPAQAHRRTEFLALAAATVVVLFGLVLAWQAKSKLVERSAEQPINLRTVERSEQLLPALQPVFSNAAERQYAARKIFEFLSDNRIENVGAIGRIRVPTKELISDRRLQELRSRAANARGTQVRLLNNADVQAVKPLLIVRTEGEFRNQVLLWAALYFLAFFAVHGFFRIRRFNGLELILPVILLLTGAGLIEMLALRDPLRDTMSVVEFSRSVTLGAIVLAALSQPDYSRLTGRLSFVPLLAAIALSLLLIFFGSGPGTSDVKVNLLGFQPVELIKVLIVLFLAGYFARRWEFLRVLKENRPELAGISKYVEVPRLEYLLPVLVAVGLTLVFFFLQKDLGPALVISCVFLALYAIARNSARLAIAGFTIVLVGFLLGYALGFPRTVHDRVSMWLSPWDNAVRGGEQVVHSLWAMATGGLFGTGPGLGDPQVMPAAHTDLILAVAGEEWGFVGLLAIFLLYASLIYIGLRIAIRARDDYGFFLSLGLTLLIAFSTILIAGGVLDLLPLSGVVTPFLSYGGTAMLVNFAVFGMLLSLSRHTGPPEQTQPFRLPVRRLAQVLGVAGVALIGKAAWVQVVRADPLAGAGTLTIQADGFRRYQYNPRLIAVASSIPRGSIFDRNGLPLASSDYAQIQKHQPQFAGFGINVDMSTRPSQDRHYPLGPYTFHILGDLRTRANWGARNSSYVERDSMDRLQGYNDRARVVEVPHPATGKPTYTVRYDFRELLPLLRHRHQPDHPEVRKILERERDVRTTIDARLQVRTARILETALKRLNKQRGAAVVIDPDTGDLLAGVSYPWPAAMPPQLGLEETSPALLDRARYGLYPPGSTFKVVTAMAALRRDPQNTQMTYECRRLPDGRVGNNVRGWSRPVRDDVMDKAPHGAVAMRQGMVVSCNAYFAQLGTYKVGASALKETADLFGISTGDVDDALPQASYGQAQVVASPFQMARVAAAVAADGMVPQGRWIADESNARVEAPVRAVAGPLAKTLGEYMRAVVTNGTGRQAAGAPLPIAGKTGTAEVEQKPSHAWFIGFAPYGNTGRQIAFAVLVENGQYGGSAAAPIAREIVAAAAALGGAATNEANSRN